MEKKIVTIDFDKTLTKSHVQKYCRKLIKAGIEVHILTYRYDDLHFHLYNGLYPEINDDLYEVVDNLGLSRNRIIFTNATAKSTYLKNSFVILHLDDDVRVMKDLTKNSHVIPIQVRSSSFENKINKILKIGKYEKRRR